MFRTARSTCLIAFAAFLCAGGTAVAAPKKDKVAVTIDKTFFDRKIERIGILTIITPTLEVPDDRIDMMGDLASAAIQDQGDYYMLFVDDLKTQAERSGGKEAYETLIRVWNGRRELDPPSLVKLQAATSVDALVAVEVTHFEQHKLEFTEEGHSTTTIGLKVRMYDARDRTLLWEASEIKVAKSVPYNPEAFVTSDAGGVARQGIKGVPDPPEYEVVAQEVVDDVIGTFPKEKAQDEKKKSKNGDE